MIIRIGYNGVFLEEEGRSFCIWPMTLHDRTHEDSAKKLAEFSGFELRDNVPLWVRDHK